MSNMLRRRWWPVICFALLVGVVAVILGYLFSAHDRGLTGTVVQAVSAVVVPAAGLGLWLWRRHSRRPAGSAEAEPEVSRVPEGGSEAWGSVRTRHVSGHATVVGVDAEEARGGTSIRGETFVEGTVGDDAKVYGVKVRRLGGTSE